MATRAEVRITGAQERRELLRERLAFSVIERGDVVIRSMVDPALPLNEHLVWFWGMLKHSRRFLKGVRQEGGRIVCLCEVTKGTLTLRPNAAEMLHLLDIELVIETR